jgi:hypothetical protein
MEITNLKKVDSYEQKSYQYTKFAMTKRVGKEIQKIKSVVNQAHVSIYFVI